jgi:hypothetical protein
VLINSCGYEISFRTALLKMKADIADLAREQATAGGGDLHANLKEQLIPKPTFYMKTKLSNLLRGKSPIDDVGVEFHMSGQKVGGMHAAPEEMLEGAPDEMMEDEDTEDEADDDEEEEVEGEEEEEEEEEEEGAAVEEAEGAKRALRKPPPGGFELDTSRLSFHLKRVYEIFFDTSSSRNILKLFRKVSRHCHPDCACHPHKVSREPPPFCPVGSHGSR